MSKETRERNDAIISMRKSGYTYDKIWKAFGLTGSRIQAICELEEHRKRQREKYKDFAGLSTRAMNALLRAGIENKEDAVKAIEEGEIAKKTQHWRKDHQRT